MEITINERWRAQEASLRAEDFFAALASEARGEPFCFLYGRGERERRLIAGMEPLLVFDSFDFPAVVARRSGELPPIFPDALGVISYEYARRYEPLLPAPKPHPLGDFPTCSFAAYKKLWLYDDAEKRLYRAERALESGLGKGLDESLERGAAQAVEPPALSKNSQRFFNPDGDFSARKIGDTDSREDFCAKVATAREAIARGDVYQANVTRQEEWRYSGSLAAFARRLYAENPAPFSALWTDGRYAVVSSSPERFARLSAGEILAMPIKGTAPRGTTPEEDERLANELLRSEKNLAELAMITDLLRNDLSRVAAGASVRVEEFPRLERYANVFHLVSLVKARLRAGATVEDLARAAFPGGSITGCPKLSAMLHIRALEALPRLAYTGCLGWRSFDGSEADLNICIRTCVADAERLFFGVGGGITWDSDPADEYEETLHKSQSLLRCLR